MLINKKSIFFSKNKYLKTKQIREELVCFFNRKNLNIFSLFYVFILILVSFISKNKLACIFILFKVTLVNVIY